MDWALIFTITGTGVAVIAAILGAICAITSLIKTDITQLKTEMQLFKGELHTDLKSFEGEVRSWKEEIYKEMKDFHGRLCSLEGRMKTDP